MADEQVVDAEQDALAALEDAASEQEAASAAEDSASEQAEIATEETTVEDDSAAQTFAGEGLGALPNGDEVHLTRFALTTNPNDGTLPGFGIKDGTAPFDKIPDVADPDGPGNDSGPANNRVRTFDTVTYSLDYSTAVYSDAKYAEYDQAWLWLEIDLPYSKEQAQVALGSMNWLSNVTSTVTEKDGKPLQVVKGRYLLVHTDNIPNSVPGSGTLEVNIDIYNMANGTKVVPTFKAWMDGNDTTNETCPTHKTKEVFSVTNGDVEVTSAPSYNVQLRQVGDGYVDGMMDFDFGTGNSQALNPDAGVVNGRLTAYGVTLQFYNANKGKGLRGIEYPTGPIEITLDLTSTFRVGGTTNKIDVTDEYQPLVWSQGENKDAVSDDGRAYPASCYQYAVHSAPGTRGGTGAANQYNYCYNSGDWQGSQTGRTVTLTISGYQIDGSQFPNADLGYGWTTNEYFDYRTGVSNIGCFSGGKLFVVQPFYNNGNGDGTEGDYILDDNVALGLENKPASGDFFTKVTLTGATIHTASTGETESVPWEQANVKTDGSDDARETQMYLTRPGRYDTRIMYGTRATASYDRDIQNIGSAEGGAYASGRDWAMPGHQFALRWGCVFWASGDSANVTYAADSLIKFDPAAIELAPTYSAPATSGGYTGNYSNSSYGYSCSFIYAAKKDGSAWTDDAEMNSTTMSQLVYYDTLDDLKADNKTCIGVVAQFRKTDLTKPDCTISGLTLSCQLGAKIKNDADLIGNFYMINTETYEWNKGQYEKLCAENDGNFPSQLNNATRDAFAAQVAAGIGTAADQMVWRSSPSYIKEGLNDDGTYKNNHTGSYQFGDSVQIIGALSGVLKQVEQKQPDGKPLNTYNLGDDQRYVDWIITPELKTNDNKEDGTEKLYTYFELIDTVPAGLSYKALSAYWGGTYTQADKTGRHGTITGGTEIPLLVAEPATEEERNTYTCYMVATTNTNGTTTLKFRFNNVEVGSEIAQIHYSTLIGTPDNPKTDVVNNQEFVNTVDIKTPVDKRTISIGNGTRAQAGMKVQKLAAVSLQKYALNKVNERTDTLTYTLITANNAAITIDDNMVIDRLPYDNDPSGSKIHNDFSLADVVIDKTNLGATSLAQVEVYVTTDTSYRGKTDVEIGTNSFRDTEVKASWTKCPIDTATGKADVSGITGQPVMVAIVGPLEPGEIHRVTLSIKPSNPDVTDIFTNSLASNGTSVTAKTEFATRNLSGLAWYDTNQDGIQDAGEPIFSGVTATLYQWNDTTKAYVSTGKTTTTGTDGSYKFTGLDAGTYAVHFTDTTDTSSLGVTKRDATTDDTKDSDADESLKEDKTRDYAVISGIQMPLAKDMDGKTYESEHHDVGYTNTIWVANITADNEGGKVKVSNYNDTESTVSSDGNDNTNINRKPTNTVIATPDAKWLVNTKTITINGVTAQLKDDGTFSQAVSGKTHTGTWVKNPNGSLTVAITNFATAKTNVDVGLSFVPTVWVANNTTDNMGGKVKVDGFDDTESIVSSDGSDNDANNRKEGTAFIATPDAKWEVNPSGFTLNGKSITPNDDGKFTVVDGSHTFTGTVIANENGSYKIALDSLPAPVDVQMGFTPTTWVANNTNNNKGGKVKIDGYDDTESNVSSDGDDDDTANRKPGKTFVATPDSEWVVDPTNFTINNKVITPNDDGTFTVTDDDGNVFTGTVVANDDGGYKVVLDSLPAPRRCADGLHAYRRGCQQHRRQQGWHRQGRRL